MHGFKEIEFKYHPGYFGGRTLPCINIKVNANHVSYQEVYNDWDGKEIKGPMWKSKTDSALFDDLTEQIPHGLYRPMDTVFDADGTLIIAKREDGKRDENYIPLSFFDNDLGRLAEPLIKLLKGLKLPPFLQEYKEADDEEEDEE